MFRTDVMVAHTPRLVYGKLKNLLCTRRKLKTLIRTTFPGASHSFDKFFQTNSIQSQISEHAPSYSAFFIHQAEQQMFCTDVVVLKAFGCFLRQTQDPSRTLTQTFHSVGHRSHSLSADRGMILLHPPWYCLLNLFGSDVSFSRYYKSRATSLGRMPDFEKTQHLQSA